MEIEVKLRVAVDHLLAIGIGIGGIEDAQRIGQHETADGQVAEGIDKLEDIFGRVLDAVRPVLQINVHPDAAPRRLFDHATDVGQMLLGRPAELLGHVLVGAFAEEVHHAAACRLDPVQRDRPVDETEHFELVDVPRTPRPCRHALHAFKLAFGNACRGNLQAVHPEVDQRLRDAQLLMRRKRDAGGLLPVPQGRIHYFYFHHRCHSLARPFSNASILSRLARR